MEHQIIVFTSFSFLVLFTLGISYGSDDANYRFEVGSSAYNLTYNDWVVKWWQWYLSVPKTHSPNNLDFPNHIPNQTCSVNQDSASPVFFLFTPYVEEKIANRTCEIPTGKAIFIPTVAGIMDTGDPESFGKSDQELINMATDGNNGALISVKLDGIPLDFSHDQKYRTLTKFFNFTLPEHNIWEEKEKPGTYKGVAEGYYLFLKPLTAGKHTLYYEAATTGRYEQTVTYNLDVK